MAITCFDCSNLVVKSDSETFGVKTCTECKSKYFYFVDEVGMKQLRRVEVAKPSSILTKSRNKGVVFIEGENNPDWVKQDRRFDLGGKPTTPGYRVCHFCNREFMENQVQRGIVGFTVVTLPFLKVYSRTGYACREHANQLKPFKTDGKITNQNVHTESEG